MPVKKKTYFILIFLFLLTYPVYSQEEFKLDSTTKQIPDLIELAPLKLPSNASFILEKIEVIGSQRQTLIKTATFLQSGQEISPLELQKALERVRDLGYFTEVKPVKVLENRGIKLMIFVKENPILKQVKLSSDLRVFSSDTLTALFQYQLGKTGNFNDIRRAKEAIEKLYQEKGYTLARVGIVQPPLLQNTNRLIDFDGSIQLQVNEGIIESLEVSGHKESNPNLVLREFPFKSGDLFQQEVAQQAVQRLYQTPWFKQVTLKPMPGKLNPQHIILKIEVEEDKTLLMDYGGGYNFRDGLTGSFKLSKENFRGQGQHLGLKLWMGLDVFNLYQDSSDLNAAQRSLLGRIDFFDPWLFPERTSFGTSLYSERVPLFFGQSITLDENLNPIHAILQTKTGISINTSKPLFGHFITSPWKVGVQFRAEQVNVANIDRQVLPELTTSKRRDGSDHIFALKGSLTHDSRNHFLTPTKGWLGSLNLEHIWGDTNYQKITGNLSQYWGLTNWLTLASGISGGAYLGNNPLYEQFYSNGPMVIRGWRENGFLYGNQFVIGSFEARFPIFNPVSGVFFTDIGEFFPLRALNSEINQGLPFKYGVGVGLRVLTPLGLLRLDYGVRDFTNFEFDTLLDVGQIHFSFGQKF